VTVSAVQCEGCGGAVAHEAGASLPRCLFCGRDALKPADVDAGAQPTEYVPFSVDSGAAKAAFKGWARRRFWAPAGIRSARVELSRLFVPAWTWDGELETHWTGVISAATRSGKRPVTGSERGEVAGVLVPSSPALTPSELDAIAPFPVEGAQPLDGAEPPGPWEVARLSPEVARARGVDGMAREHGARIAARSGVREMKTSAVALRADGRPLLLPVWIGAYVFKDDSYRVVVNGRTGAVTGSAPVAWWKVAMAVLALLGVALVVVAIAASQ